MLFRIRKSQHLSELINKIDAIYICDDVNDFYYSDELDESANSNTIPQDTIISKSDVENILSKIKKCNSVFVEPRPKNASFISKYNLSSNDCKAILDSLTVDDYIKNTISVNSNNLGDNLIIFEPSTLVINGNQIEGVIIYIKIDMDESTDTSVVAVSFHQTNRKDK